MEGVTSLGYRWAKGFGIRTSEGIKMRRERGGCGLDSS